MNKQKEQVCNAWNQEARKATYEEYSANKVVPGKFGIIEVGEEKTRIYGLISDRLYEHDKDANERCWFYPLTGGCFSLDITTGARHKNAIIISIEITTDEVAKARYKTLLNLTDAKIVMNLKESIQQANKSYIAYQQCKDKTLKSR